jgi:carbamoyl-phosphate synthase/aspartate carbamoyltransferase/dihydroorotase
MRLPGLIDPHVHLRYLDPQKEDFLTGASAAIAGGFTMVLDMPNNNPPITTFPRLQAKIDQARRYTRSDIGFYFGSLGDNLSEFEKVKDLVFGLKLYLNQTTGGYIIDEPVMKKIYQKWHTVTRGEKPILLHAEADMLPAVARVISQTNQPTHICHVSSHQELSQVMQMKQAGLPVTCGVTPHHLFLTSDDAKQLGPYGLMKPSLASKRDQDFLWDHWQDIDVVESDHAPHTKADKESGHPPFGVPGLETTLPLLLTAMNQGRITKEDIIEKCHTRPKEIFHIPNQPETYIEVDEHEAWIVKNEELFTKCRWSPFDGRKVQGKVVRVYIRGTKVFENGKILAQPGSGKVYG